MDHQELTIKLPISDELVEFDVDATAKLAVELVEERVQVAIRLRAKELAESPPPEKDPVKTDPAFDPGKPSR